MATKTGPGLVPRALGHLLGLGPRCWLLRWQSWWLRLRGLSAASPNYKPLCLQPQAAPTQPAPPCRGCTPARCCRSATACHTRGWPSSCGRRGLRHRLCPMAPCNALSPSWCSKPRSCRSSTCPWGPSAPARWWPVSSCSHPAPWTSLSA